MEKPYSYLQFLCALLMFFIIDVNGLLLDNSIEIYIKESIKMETKTDTLSDKDIENVKVSIESIVFQYVGSLPDSVIIQIIDDSLIAYSMENKATILKGIVFLQNKIKERDILEYISDEFYKRHVDEIDIQFHQFDYNDEKSYYDATSAGKIPLYKLLEEQQFHQTLNIGLKTAQAEFRKKLQLILNEYKTAIDTIKQKEKNMISFIQDYKMDGNIFDQKYENKLNPTYEKDGESSTLSDKFLNFYFEQSKNKDNLVSGQFDEKKFAISFTYNEEYNIAAEKKKEALKTLFEQHGLALKTVFEQRKEGCSSFVKPEEKELAPVTTFEEYLAELKSFFQSAEDKPTIDFITLQVIEFITLQIHEITPEETTLDTTYSGTRASENCMFKSGVKICMEKLG